MTPSGEEAKCPGCGYETMIWEDDNRVNTCPECGVDAIMPIEDAEEVMGNRMAEEMGGGDETLVFGDFDDVLRLPSRNIDSLSISYDVLGSPGRHSLSDFEENQRMSLSIDASITDEAIMEAMRTHIEDLQRKSLADSHSLTKYSGAFDHFEGP